MLLLLFVITFLLGTSFLSLFPSLVQSSLLTTYRGFGIKGAEQKDYLWSTAFPPFILNSMDLYCAFQFMKHYFFKFIFLRERERAGEGQREREGERESQAGSALSAQSLMWGWNS